jgi:TM2 domain-containing membrane protein YozV
MENSKELIEEEIRSTLSRARVHLKRGEKDSALRLVEELKDKYPDEPDAQEAFADVLVGLGRKQEAIQVLKKVIDEHPGRVETEKRHAQLVFGMHQHEFEQYGLMLESQEAIGPRSAGTASFLGLLFPGLGQVYVGQIVRGIVYAGMAIVGFLLLLSIGTGPAGLNGTGIGIIVGLAVVWIVGILDAAVSARGGADVSPKERPKPPVDLPFE